MKRPISKVELSDAQYKALVRNVKKALLTELTRRTDTPPYDKVLAGKRPKSFKVQALLILGHRYLDYRLGMSIETHDVLETTLRKKIEEGLGMQPRQAERLRNIVLKTVDDTIQSSHLFPREGRTR